MRVVIPEWFDEWFDAAFPPTSSVYTVKEIAGALRYDPGHIYRLLRNGDIEGFAMAGNRRTSAYRVPRAVLRLWLINRNVLNRF